jgi:hypothetical protein
MSVQLASRIGVLGFTSGKFLTIISFLLLAKFQQQVRWLQPGPLMVHRSFQPPAKVFLVVISLKGVPLLF